MLLAHLVSHSDVHTVHHGTCAPVHAGGYCKSRYRPGFTVHSLRHTWTSWLVMAGTPISMLMELGGWSDLRMVLPYAHLSDDHVAEYTEKLKPMGRF